MAARPDAALEVSDHAWPCSARSASPSTRTRTSCRSSRPAPPTSRSRTSRPPAKLPDDPGPAVSDSPAGCADLPEVRFYHWAWNAQMGMMLATGGKQATADSLMCKNGVNLKLIREDNTDNMQSAAGRRSPRRSRRARRNPTDGRALRRHHGRRLGARSSRGSTTSCAKLGPDYIGVVVGSAGYSRGEDKFMGPPAWKENPQAARGGLVAGVLRDGDWNIALKWLGDNKIPNNPDETTYDPDALNWVNATDYIEAAQKYVSGFCTELKNVKTGKKEKHCVDGVVTWTPGRRDRGRAEGRPRLDRLDQGVPLADAERDHRQQEVDERPTASSSKGMLARDLRGRRQDQDERRRAAARPPRSARSSTRRRTRAYWYKYFKPSDAEGQARASTSSSAARR